MASKGLFDHITAITKTQDPNYWTTLDESSKKTFSNYMVLRYISMNPDWLDLVAEIQPYAQTLPPELLYKVLIGLIPKSKTYLKYIGGGKKNTTKYESWLIDLIVIDLKCSKLEAVDYLDILFQIKGGHADIYSLCKNYGIEEKEIKKLKLHI